MTDKVNTLILSDQGGKQDFKDYFPEDFEVQYSSSIKGLDFLKNSLVFIDARLITQGDMSIALNEKKSQAPKSLCILFFTEPDIQEGYSKFDSCIDDVILLGNPSEVKLKLHYIKNRLYELNAPTEQIANDLDAKIDIDPIRYNELEQSEELHRVILSNISDAVFVTDERGDYTFVCPNVNVIFGYDREEVLEMKNISSLLGKYIHMQEFNDEVTEKSNIEIVTPDKGGKLHHLLVNIKKVNIHRGRYLYSCRDITYRKSIEAKLLESETTCQQLFDISPAAMRLMDKSRNIIMSNKLYGEYNKKFGFKTIDKCCNSFNAGVCFTEKCSLNAVVQTKKPVSGFFEYKTPQNEPVNFLLDAIPFRNHKNEIVGVLESFRDVTELKKAETTIAERELQFNQLAENIKEVFWIFDWEEQHVKYVSPAFEEVWGIKPEELYNDYSLWGKSIYHNDATYAYESFQQIARGKLTQPRQYRIVKPDGSIRWIEDKGFPVFDKSKKLTKIVGVAEDITERKQTEIELSKLAVVTEQNPIGIIITNTKGIIEYVNSAFAQSRGYTRDELIGSSPANFNAGFHPKEFFNELWRTIKNGDIWKGNIKNKSKDGKLFWEKVIISPVSSENGIITHFVGMQEDITEQIMAQKALKESEERYRLLHEVAGVSIGYFKQNGDIISLNKLATKYIGGNPQDYIGKNIIDVYSEEEATKHFRRFESVIKFGVMFEYEDHMQTQDGAKWFLSTYNIVESEDKKLLGIQVLSKDITEQMNARLQVEKYMQRLTSIINTVGDGITLADSDGNFEIYNPKMQEITGYSKIEVYKKSTFYNVLYPDIEKRDAVLRDIEKLKVDKKNLTYETNIITKEGGSKTLLVTSSIFVDEGNEYFLNSYTDITDRKKYLEEIQLYQNHLEELVAQGIAKLQHSEQKYSELFRAMRSGFLRKSVEGDIIECNDAFQQMIKYPLDELYKLKDSDITPSKWQKQEELIFKGQILKQGYSDLYEKEYMRKDGTIFPAEIQTYLTVENDNIAGTWSIVHDITERKELERKIVRTITDTEEKERKRFSSDLHDSLGALLSGIKMYLNLLHSGKLNETETDKIYVKAKQLVSSAVNSTREISANIMPPEISRYGLVKSLQSFFERINETGRINISFNHENYRPLLKKEEDLILYRVINELLNNTLKHSNAEHVEVNIYTYEDTAFIIYSDDGIGFDFNAIMQEQKGIGLQNITNRIESINGNITFDTSPGNGVIVVMSIKSQ